MIISLNMMENYIHRADYLLSIKIFNLTIKFWYDTINLSFLIV